jgi:hypothetical protein
MGYRLAAVIGPAAVLSAAAAEQPGMAVVPLGQGLGLVPMTDEVFDAVNDGTPPELPGFEVGPLPAAGTPIAQALAHLGVRRGDHVDEFAAAGLGQHRDTEDWLP